MALKSNKRALEKAARTSKWPSDLGTIGITQATAEDFKWLQAHVVGEVCLPGDADYDSLRAQNPLYPVAPQAIVMCAAFEDVRACLQFSAKHGLWVMPRAGRHSSAGFSTNTGLVIDVSRISYAVVDPERRTARVGAGTSFGVLNAQLDVYRLHVPGGTCPDVCVAGFMQGGGYGFTSRELGMGCDSIIGALVMLADGRVVVANDRVNHDLFWAIRGGTGANFGVLLELTFALEPIWKLFGYAIAWPLADAPRVLDALQSQFMTGKNDVRVGYLCVLTTLKEGQVLTMIGTYHGTEEEGRRALAPVVGIGSPRWLLAETDTYAVLNEALLNVLPGPGDAGTIELKEAHYIAQPVGVPRWETMCQAFAKTPNTYNIACIEPYGGQINLRPKLWNAFVHREVSMDFFVDAFWNPIWPESPDEKGAQAFLDAMMKSMAPTFDTFVYQNYPRRQMPDFRWAYWGDAFPSLLFIKDKYDPENVFHFEQSVTPYPADPGIHRSTARSLFHDPHIQYPPWS
ncbi:MAG: FAD-binding oxidoreductase [Polyangiaceae bacterium]|jgi:FAD/FMN-containing dehydrogenase